MKINLLICFLQTGALVSNISVLAQENESADNPESVFLTFDRGRLGFKIPPIIIPPPEWKIDPVTFSKSEIFKTELKPISFEPVPCELPTPVEFTLPQIDFSYNDLSGRDLTGGHFFANNFNHAQMFKTILTEAKLMLATLIEADLREATLMRADLRGANLSGVDLSGANLGGANLTFAKLKGANLSGANFREANLEFADLSGANIIGADFNQAHLENAILENVIRE